MKKLLSVCFCLGLLVTQAKSFDRDLKVVKNTIRNGEKIIGSIKTTEKDCLYGNKQKANLIQVKIYNSQNNLIAAYDVKVRDKVKRHENVILEASLHTYRDRAVHDGANFLDYNQEPAESEVPQLEKAVEYLSENKYL